MSLEGRLPSGPKSVQIEAKPQAPKMPTVPSTKGSTTLPELPDLSNKRPFNHSVFTIYHKGSTWVVFGKTNSGQYIGVELTDDEAEHLRCLSDKHYEAARAEYEAEKTLNQYLHSYQDHKGRIAVLRD